MDEILTYVYEQIKGIDIIKTNFDNRIYFYEPSENDDTSRAFIVLDPLLPFDTSLHASNDYHSRNFHFQMDIETYDFYLTHQTATLIIDHLKKCGLSVEAGGMDEYFKDTKRYVISKRFYGTPKLLNKN